MCNPGDCYPCDCKGKKFHDIFGFLVMSCQSHGRSERKSIRKIYGLGIKVRQMS
jgi:hypothetical protein